MPATPDPIEAAICDLNQAVASNHDLIMANRDLIMENREIIMQNTRQLTELNDKVDAMMKHQNVPYKSTGFLSEDRKP